VNPRLVFPQLIISVLLSGLTFLSGCSDDSATGLNQRVSSSSSWESEIISSSSQAQSSSPIEISSSGESPANPSLNPDIDYATLTDSRDGQIYYTVTIGAQTWMAENLNYDTLNGTGSWCYQDEASHCETYGRLYTWNAVLSGSEASDTEPSDVQGLCPSGWHLPSDAEWNTLANYVDANNGSDGTGYSLKSRNGWEHSSDAFGFASLPAGRAYPNGTFKGIGNSGYWWSSGENGNTYGWGRLLELLHDDFRRLSTRKGYALSVRCLQD